MRVLGFFGLVCAAVARKESFLIASQGTRFVGGVLTTPVTTTMNPSIHLSIPPSGGGRVEKRREELPR